MSGLALNTAAGYWAPLLFLAGLAIALAVAALIRSRGNANFSRGTEQESAFFSGNRAPEENIAGENFYWGLFSAGERYFRLLKSVHSGLVNDYVYCFVILLIVLLAAALLGGIA
ncbi:MAG: hypothetical protein JW744_02090 [Candidatus Diapherotrites archaeon]|uniref:Hydrogenase n=1 Tax=Candidatus Iainarchaeum sp. TaxID=3101447 RepID=A0A939CA04_9ARCH|nr:hypothetical protein [Candidatus Diapherotrites archaeon]